MKSPRTSWWFDVSCLLYCFTSQLTVSPTPEDVLSLTMCFAVVDTFCFGLRGSLDFICKWLGRELLQCWWWYKNGKPSVHLHSAPVEQLLQRGSPDLVWFAAEAISDINQHKEIYSVIYSWYVDFGSMTGMSLHTSRISNTYRFIWCKSMQMFPFIPMTDNTRWRNDASTDSHLRFGLSNAEPAVAVSRTGVVVSLGESTRWSWKAGSLWRPHLCSQVSFQLIRIDLSWNN